MAVQSGPTVTESHTPLYIVGNTDKPGAMTIGSAVANVSVKGVMAEEHIVQFVDDHAIHVDVLIGRT